MSQDFTTPVGRLVSGHPMKMQPVTDDNGAPKLDLEGKPKHEIYFAIAIAKGRETDWRQTDWGQKVYAEGMASWPNGEYQSPSFAWKITDGDSTIPNKTGKKPCDREGWAGHWVVHCKTSFAISCYNYGKYNPMTDQIANPKEIKAGDYVRTAINVKGNNPSKSPGVYMNPTQFESYRAGVAIISENAPDPTEAFGAVPAQLPAGALVDGNVPAPVMPVSAPAMPGMAPPPPPVTPAPDFLKPPKVYKYQGAEYTEAQLKGFGWSDAQIATLN